MNHPDPRASKRAAKSYSVKVRPSSSFVKKPKQKICVKKEETMGSCKKYMLVVDNMYGN